MCPAISTIEGFQIHTAEIEHSNLNKKLLITTSPVPDESGEFTHIVHIAKDITDVDHSTGEISNNSSQLNQHTEQLKDMSEKLTKLVGRFKV